MIFFNANAPVIALTKACLRLGITSFGSLANDLNLIIRPALSLGMLGQVAVMFLCATSGLA